MWYSPNLKCSMTTIFSCKKRAARLGSIYGNAILGFSNLTPEGSHDTFYPDMEAPFDCEGHNIQSNKQKSSRTEFTVGIKTSSFSLKLSLICIGTDIWCKHLISASLWYSGQKTTFDSNPAYIMKMSYYPRKMSSALSADRDQQMMWWFMLWSFYHTYFFF